MTSSSIFYVMPSASVCPDPSTTHDSLRLTFAPLSLPDAYALANDSANGAIVVMSGMVRDNTDGRAVSYLEYQAYEPMALEVFKQIAAQIRQQWTDVTRLVIHHRTGKLLVGEISVLVAVGCPHRGEAFAACQYAIDTLKHNAPIWKKEYWEDGSTSWVSIGACEQGEIA
jgi:molybdopterin synthase catalytic subunit